MDEPEENILQFNEEEYRKKQEKFEKDVQLIFDGKVCKRVCEYIEKEISK